MSASNFIQWKGTDLCMDLNCKCGHLGHVDAYFCYYVKCGNCGTIYKMADNVDMEDVGVETPRGVASGAIQETD